MDLDAIIRGPGAPTKETINKAPAEASFAEALNQSFEKYGEPKISPTPQQNAVAGLMLSAMLQAAKCDGRIDEGEKKEDFAAPRRRFARGARIRQPGTFLPG